MRERTLREAMKGAARGLREACKGCARGAYAARKKHRIDWRKPAAFRLQKHRQMP